jgi:hypothetical protein
MRFFKPSATEYQSQFSPLNLDFMQKNLAQKEANDVVAEDLLDKTSQLQVEGGMVSDPNEVKKYNDWIQTNTANIREKFASGDMDAKEASRNLAKIIQVYNTNEDIKFFNTDQKLSALTRQRIAEGKANNAISSNISYLNGNLEAEALSSKSGLDALARAHNLTNPTGIYDKENYQHQMDKFVGDAVSNQFDLAPKEYDKLTGVPMITMGNHKYTREELKAEKVREWARNVWEQENRNSNTPFMQYQKQLYGLSGGEYTQQQFIEDAANGFPGYYKREVTQDNTSYQQMAQGEKPVEEVDTTSRQSEALPNIELEDETKEMTFDKNGNLTDAKKPARKVISSGNSRSPSGQNAVYSDNEIDKNKTNNQKALLISIRKNNPELEKLPDAQVAKAYSKARKSLNSESIPLTPISGQARLDIGKSLVNDMLGRSVYLYDSQGFTEDGNLKTALKKSGLTLQEFNKALKEGITGYTQAGPSPGSYYVEVAKEGESVPRRFLISQDAEHQKTFSTSQAVNTARKSMLPTKITPYQEIPNYTIDVIPTIKANGTVTWEYIESDGVNSYPTSLDNIRKAEREHFANSKLLKSNVTVQKGNTAN